MVAEPIFFKEKSASSVGALIYGPRDRSPAGLVYGAGDYMPAELREWLYFAISLS
jgi:hypothetical protein